MPRHRAHRVLEDRDHQRGREQGVDQKPEQKVSPLAVRDPGADAAGEEEKQGDKQELLKLVGHKLPLELRLKVSRSSARSA